MDHAIIPRTSNKKMVKLDKFVLDLVVLLKIISFLSGHWAGFLFLKST